VPLPAVGRHRDRPLLYDDLSSENRFPVHHLRRVDYPFILLKTILTIPTVLDSEALRPN